MSRIDLVMEATNAVRQRDEARRADATEAQRRQIIERIKALRDQLETLGWPEQYGIPVPSLRHASPLHEDPATVIVGDHLILRATDNAMGIEAVALCHKHPINAEAHAAVTVPLSFERRVALEQLGEVVLRRDAGECPVCHPPASTLPGARAATAADQLVAAIKRLVWEAREEGA